MSTVVADEPVLDQVRQAKKNMKEQLQEEHKKTLIKIGEIDQWFEQTYLELKKVGLDFNSILKNNLILPTVEKSKRINKAKKKPEEKVKVFTSEEQKIIDFAKINESGFTYKELISNFDNKEGSNSVIQTLITLLHEGYIKEIPEDKNSARKFVLIT